MSHEARQVFTSIVVDLDGTLCNTRHRQHLFDAGDWDEYHAAHVNDEVYSDIAWILDRMQSTGDQFEIIGVTARPEKHVSTTMSWLIDNEISVDHVLMRPKQSFETEPTLKPKLVANRFGDNEIAKASVAMIFEDDPKCVDVWRACGFRCAHVQPGGM